MGLGFLEDGVSMLLVEMAPPRGLNAVVCEEVRGGDGVEREGGDDEVLCWADSMADRMSRSDPLGRSMGLLDDLK